MTKASGHILDYKPDATGRTRREVSASVRYRPSKLVKSMPVTVPKGTPAVRIAGSWWVAELAWLEPLTGAPEGMERASVIYHGARHFGVEVDAADVVED